MSSDDREAVASLLTRCFPVRTLAFWRDALRRLDDHSRLHGAPAQGHLLLAGDALVGCLLTIWSRREVQGRTMMTCNLSSWCAEDPYRSYASLLVRVATRDRTATYTDDSPAPHTHAVITAQGFRPYVTRSLWAPTLLPRVGSSAARVVDGPEGPPGASAEERELMRAHAADSCLTFWCVADGDAFPFVFSMQRCVRGLLPCGFLVYCRSLDSVGRFARQIGANLLRQGLLVMQVDTEQAIPGLPGLLRPARTQKFYKGREPPRPGDQAYSELALFRL